MVEQVPNIEKLGEVFEPINSPEYNQFCKEVGLAISYVGGKYSHYTHKDGDCTIIHNPLFDGKKPIPFRLNDNYKDPRDVEREFFKRELEAGNLKSYILDASIYNRESNINYIKEKDGKWKRKIKRS